ncbi:MAG: hypothetical protein CFE24_08045 [Flavobacterium sp. BFFFF2]|nr:MAG: hypothetical protein CFE24_08045 [Flavobacterium sp. BFFFF2]
MKYSIVLCVCFLLECTNLFSQQNLFNIPSGDITNPKKIFYQHQLNLYSDKLESKAHFVYGLGKGWDGGINLVGKGLYFSPNWRMLHNDDPNKGALYPILMATIQKQIKVTEQFDVNFGSQFGYNLSSQISNKEINFYNYCIGVYHFMEGKARFVGGFYQTNQMYVGEGDTIGIMFGYEMKISKRWYLMGDWVSGNNDAAVSVLGGMYNLSKRIQLCGGWQIPNPNTPKPMGFVFELNLSGWDVY